MALLKREGFSGTIVINDQHNPIKPTVIMQVKNGQSNYVTTVFP